MKYKIVDVEKEFYLIMFEDSYGEKKMWSLESTEERANEEFDYILKNFINGYKKLWIERKFIKEITRYNTVRAVEMKAVEINLK